MVYLNRSDAMKTMLSEFYQKYKVYIKGILAILLFFYSSAFSMIPIWLFQLDPNKITAKENLMLGIFNYVILFLIYILMYKKDFLENLKDFKKRPNKIIDVGFKYWTIGLFFMVISNLILMKFFPGTSSNNENAVQLYIQNFPILAIISTSLLGPFIEEVVFRKTFKDMIKKPIFFILISGIVFGLMHVLGQATTLAEFLYFIPYAALGISFAWMYYKTDNFFTPCMMHFIHNLILTLISIIGLSL